MFKYKIFPISFLISNLRVLFVCTEEITTRLSYIRAHFPTYMKALLGVSLLGVIRPEYINLWFRIFAKRGKSSISTPAKCEL